MYFKLRSWRKCPFVLPRLRNRVLQLVSSILRVWFTSSLNVKMGLIVGFVGDNYLSYYPVTVTGQIHNSD